MSGVSRSCAYGHTRQSGQSMVELAILLPVLLWILLGAVDFGRVYYTSIAITNAARVGSAYGMDSRRQNADILAVVVAEARPLVEIDPARVTLTRATSTWGNTPGIDLTVSVEHDFVAITPFISRLWSESGEPLTLRAQSNIRLIN